MKIGFLTFHKEINYGANLQAYAFLKYLLENSFDAEIIDLTSNKNIDRRSWKRKLLHFIKIILIPTSFKTVLKKKKFFKFQRNYYHLSSKMFLGDVSILSSNVNYDYDVIISGSDQLFNLPLSEFTFSYYLPFNHVYKFSYASSFGRKQITDIEKWAILNYLPSFNNLSFREVTGYESVNSLVQLKERNIVVDPVFLLEKEKWLSLCKHSSKKDYILVYFMEDSDWLKATIDYVCKIFPTYSLLVIPGTSEGIKIKNHHKTINTAGPIEFLSLFSNAKIIITNSFHGLSFSFIFNKMVYCCAHSSKNARLENLLQLVGEENKIISKPDYSKIEYINGEEAMTKMEKNINKSKEYIERCLKEAKND